MLKSIPELLKELEGVKFTKEEMDEVFDQITKSPKELLKDEEIPNNLC